MLPAAPTFGESRKEQVVHNAPKRIKEMRFGILYVAPSSALMRTVLWAVFLLRPGLIVHPPDYRSPQEIVKQGVIEVSTRELFDLEGGGRKAKKNGALDGRMVGPLSSPWSRQHGANKWDSPG